MAKTKPEQNFSPSVVPGEADAEAAVAGSPQPDRDALRAALQDRRTITPEPAQSGDDTERTSP